MYQIFKDQLEKSKLIISGIKRNQRMGRDAGVTDTALQKMEDDCKPCRPNWTVFRRNTAARARKPTGFSMTSSSTPRR